MRTNPGVLAFASPRPGTSTSKNWKFRIQVPVSDAPLMASLFLEKHIPLQLDSGRHSYAINNATKILVPVNSRMGSIVGIVDLEQSSKSLDGTPKPSCRITLKLVDSAGDVLGVESVAVDGCSGSFGFTNRHSQLLPKQKINLVKLELRDDTGRKDFAVSFQFSDNRE